MLPNAPYHGRPAMTNQDAALAGMREMQRQGIVGSGGSPGKPPLTPQQMRRKRRWRAIRSVVFAVLALAFAYGALVDLETGQYNPFGSILFASVFGLLALHQTIRFLTSRPSTGSP